MLDWPDFELEQLIRSILRGIIHTILHRMQDPFLVLYSRHATWDTPLPYRQAPRIPH
jgi:hypothetical protein